MAQPRQTLSEAACFGTVQVPSGGEAIILMADRQTTGGYPKIAQIASVDLPALAQSLPGQELRFQQIELDEAQRLDVERERAFAQLRDALAPMRAALTRSTPPGATPPDQEDHYESQHRLELRHGRKLRRLGDGQRRRRAALCQLGQHRLRFPRRRPRHHAQDRGRRPGAWRWARIPACRICPASAAASSRPVRRKPTTWWSTSSARWRAWPPHRARACTT